VSVDSTPAPISEERRLRTGFWIVTYAFLIVMSFSTLPSLSVSVSGWALTGRRSKAS